MSAYCPEKEIEGNPIIEYVKYLVFPRINKFFIKRDEKHGGDIFFASFEELKKNMSEEIYIHMT